MWWMGDSQTTHFYQAAECFLREFAADPRLERRWAGRYASEVAAGVNDLPFTGCTAFSTPCAT